RIDESTIWAPTPQQKAIYLNIVAGMAGRALVPLFNPEWVGKELSAQGISQTRDIDVLYTMRNELGRKISNRKISLHRCREAADSWRRRYFF
nr:hypothetical protein [Candidatus Sigynarchaeota archaeon]